MAVALIWLAMPAIGWSFGARSHTRRPVAGLLLGLFLGPLGLLILAALGPNRSSPQESKAPYVQPTIRPSVVLKAEGNLRAKVECLLAANYSEKEIVDYLTGILGIAPDDAVSAVSEPQYPWRPSPGGRVCVP